jgi:hypothetical protein
VAGRHRKAPRDLKSKHKQILKAGIIAAPVSAGVMFSGATSASADELSGQEQQSQQVVNQQEWHGQQDGWQGDWQRDNSGQWQGGWKPLGQENRGGLQQNASQEAQQVNPDWWNRINDPSLSEFMDASRTNNPPGPDGQQQDKPAVAKDGVDWSTDGCSGPSPQWAYDACVRHDANTRSLQQHSGYWNKQNYLGATRSQFAKDLDTEREKGNINYDMWKTMYLRGSDAGSWLPGFLTGMPDWHTGEQHYINS